MKALNLYTAQDVRCEDIDIPDISNVDDVLIEVQVAGICGSDISRFGKLGSYNPGLTWGHEFSGVVAKIGSAVKTLKAGDRVTACNCFPCYECEFCKKGRFSQCTDLKVLGGHKKGAFAKYINVPSANVVKLPEGMDFETASFIEPSSVVVHGFRLVNVKPGSSVAIVGCGTIGLLAVQWARVCGAAKIYAFDTDKNKLKIASETGATDCFCVTENDYFEEFMAVTNNAGADIVMESSGNAAGVASSTLLVAKGGTLVLLGIPYGDVAFPRTNFEKIIRSELTVVGSWNSISAPFPGEEWTTSAHFIHSGAIDVRPLISKYTTLEDAPGLFPKLYNREESFVKVLIKIGDKA